MAGDPYKTLGVRRNVSDEELRSAYRRLVQQHHPDHNRGSPESARRFEEIQEAYATISEQRRSVGGARRHASTGASGSTRPQSDPDLEARIAELQRQLREAQLARERARRDAHETTLRDAREAATGRSRPSDEELGYVSTDDSFAKILHDARAELSSRVDDLRDHPLADRVADLLDELGARLGTDKRRP